MQPITAFEGEYRWLSNFHPAIVYVDGRAYPTVEHAYQASKSLHSADRELIRNTPKAGTAKRLGAKIELRRDWEKIKLVVMEDLVRQKFTRYSDLRNKLLATGQKPLLEGNFWHDTFWGVYRGRGENHLGKIIMKVRDELQNEERLIEKMVARTR